MSSVTLPVGQNAAQVAGTGAIVSIGGPVSQSGSIFTVIGAVADFSNSGRKRGVTPTTTFDSLGIVQKVGTTLDLGSVSFTTQRVSTDAGQAACIAANLAGGAYQFRLQLPLNADIGQSSTGDLIAFAGIVTEGGSFDVSLDKASQYKFTVDLVEWTVTEGS